jgi:hypothetical protein
MGLAELLKNKVLKQDETDELLDYIMLSAQELDEIIREIVKKTS